MAPGRDWIVWREPAEPGLSCVFRLWSRVDPELGLDNDRRFERMAGLLERIANDRNVEVTVYLQCLDVTP